MTARESFCAVLSNGPLMRADAIIVLSGDGDKRLQVALELMANNTHAAPLIVVSGGVDNPPHSLSAKASAEWLIDKGLHPDLIVMESGSQNTHDQAGNIVSMAVAKRWNSLILIASPYHQFRAYLTFLRELRDFNLDEKIHLMSVPASQTQWWQQPAGMDVTRLDLLEGEFRKIDEYRTKGHVASYRDGLKYLQYWESKQWEKSA